MLKIDFIKNKNYDKFKIILYNMIILILVYNLLLRTRFQLDSYFAVMPKHSGMNLVLGRYLTHLVEVLFEYIGINLFYNQKIILIFIMISAPIFIFILTDILHKIFLMKNKNIKFVDLNIFVLVIVLNIFVLEILTFPENNIASLMTLLFLIFLVKSLYNFLIWNKKRYLLIFMLLAICLSSVYQVTISFISIFSTLIVGLYNDLILNKKMFNNLINIYAAIAFSVFINISILKLLQKFNFVGSTVRGISLPSLNDKINELIEGSKYIWIYSCRLLPKYFLLIFLVIFFILCIFNFFNSEHLLSQKIFVFLFLLFSINIIYFPHIITKVSWIVPRTLRSIGELFSGQLVIFAFIFYEKKYLLKFLKYLSILFLIVNSIVINSILSDQITTNSIDKFIANTIISKIKNYEESTGNEIRKICIVSDKNPTYFDYNYIKYGDMDINRRMFSINWAKYQGFEFYYGKKLIRVEEEDNFIKEKLKDYDWETFDPENQIFINGDVVYYISY